MKWSVVLRSYSVAKPLNTTFLDMITKQTSYFKMFMLNIFIDTYYLSSANVKLMIDYRVLYNISLFFRKVENGRELFCNSTLQLLYYTFKFL